MEEKDEKIIDLIKFQTKIIEFYDSYERLYKKRVQLNTDKYPEELSKIIEIITPENPHNNVEDVNPITKELRLQEAIKIENVDLADMRRWIEKCDEVYNEQVEQWKKEASELRNIFMDFIRKSRTSIRYTMKEIEILGKQLVKKDKNKAMDLAVKWDVLKKINTYLNQITLTGISAYEVEVIAKVKEIDLNNAHPIKKLKEILDELKNLKCKEPEHDSIAIGKELSRKQGLTLEELSNAQSVLDELGNKKYEQVVSDE